jgi:hypothetical protein
MDVAFHFPVAHNDDYQSRGRARRRLLGMVRLLADFSQGSVDVSGGVFRNWMLHEHLPQEGNEQTRREKIQQADFSFRRRWHLEATNGWFWLGDCALDETAPATEFMMVRNLSVQIAESICQGMEKRANLQFAFEVSRRSGIQNAIYYGLAERWYKFSSSRSVAYYLPFGADDDPVTTWRLRRLGFRDIERRDEMPSMEDTFFVLMRLLYEETNPKGK